MALICGGGGQHSAQFDGEIAGQYPSIRGRNDLGAIGGLGDGDGTSRDLRFHGDVGHALPQGWQHQQGRRPIQGKEIARRWRQDDPAGGGRQP